MISEYLVAWHGMANGDSQQELEFLFRDKDLHTASVSQVVSLAGRPHWHSYFSDFGIFSPPPALADRGFYGISSGSSGQTFIPQFAKVEKVNVSFRLLFGSLYSQMLEQITPRDVLYRTTDTKDTARNGRFRNGKIVTLKRKYFSKPLQIASNQKCEHERLVSSSAQCGKACMFSLV